MFKKIIVALDGFLYAEQAIPHAVALARRANARIRLIHVLDMAMRPPYAETITSHDWWNGAARAAASDYLDDQVDVVREAGVGASGIVMEGRPADAILAEADRIGAGLVVMTTHGRGPMRRIWLGSVADHMANIATLPVMFIRVLDDVAPPPPARFTNILVPLDGSTIAEEALAPALQLAALDGARITLLNVAFAQGIAIPLIAYDYANTYVPPGADLTFPEQQTGADYLDLVAESIRDRHRDVVTAVLPSVASSDFEIARYAQAKHVDLIAMATRGHGLTRSMLGMSVTDRTLQSALTPVLVLPMRAET
jgi:nucleotide-binding universal stress UspA family protein